MTCSIDLKERVINFVRSGGGKAEAARRFSVSRWSIYQWLGMDDLSPKPAKVRYRKIDWHYITPGLKWSWLFRQKSSEVKRQMLKLSC